MKGKTGLAIFATLFMAAPAFAVQSCDILGAGNKHYAAGELDKALGVYSSVEIADKVGKTECTMSVYAMMGTTYNMQAKAELPKNAVRAAELFRQAAKYNRAFAAAAICRAGDCKQSEDFWKEKDFWEK